MVDAEVASGLDACHNKLIPDKEHNLNKFNSYSILFLVPRQLYPLAVLYSPYDFALYY